MKKQDIINRIEDLKNKRLEVVKLLTSIRTFSRDFDLIKVNKKYTDYLKTLELYSWINQEDVMNVKTYVFNTRLITYIRFDGTFKSLYDKLNSHLVHLDEVTEDFQKRLKNFDDLKLEIDSIIERYSIDGYTLREFINSNCR